MVKKIISKVRQDKNRQRRITVPQEDKTLEHNDLVEIKKVDIEDDDEI